MRTLVIAAVALAVGTAAGRADARKWTDASGRHVIEAEFAGMADGRVQLEKPNGAVVEVPLRMLSAEDRTLVEALLAEPKVPAGDEPPVLQTDEDPQDVETQAAVTVELDEGGSAFAGRGSAKGRLAAAGGGSEGSERAVAMAVKWLAEHQLPDGGWSFDHTRAPSCKAQCGNPGSLEDARNAATGLALLPFLGAGQTHKEGKYKATVKDGLRYLIENMKVGPEGGSLSESGGNMYSHGIATIALCEAYAMTQDKGLYAPAQQAVNFICYAQDPVGGGWRYQPRQAGDTSVFGWQLMALKSGHMAYLHIPPVTVKKATAFLDSVQSDRGANYGYTTPGAGQATTAIGLLSRMYLGWRRDEPALERGVKWLARQGPSKGNVYYNYYATQVMHHWEGEEWKKWNSVMRDQLVNSQKQQGHETGSWFHERGDHGSARGGRVYTTAMNTLILEVYYRHLPIYRKWGTDDEPSQE